MEELKVRELHLAAFMKSNWAEFCGHIDGHFVFRSDQSLSSWRVAHSNSCCRRVDLELINLRKFLKR